MSGEVSDKGNVSSQQQQRGAVPMNEQQQRQVVAQSGHEPAEEVAQSEDDVEIESESDVQGGPVDSWEAILHPETD